MEKLLEFLKEDVGRKDITTESVIPRGIRVRAEIVAKEGGTLAGLKECEIILGSFNLKHRSSFKDGEEIKKGSIVLGIEGDARKILTLERTLLNILMRMSGIATATNAIVKKCKKYGVEVAATRKTTPGFRYFEKKAVKIGGGKTHRTKLDEAILIKSNHAALVGLEEAIKRAKEKNPDEKIEVEVSSLKDAIKACECGADIVMLDNMLPKQVRRIMQELKKRKLRGKVKIEVSGGITKKNIAEYARLKPEIISMGCLTTNAKWLDMSLKIKECAQPNE